LACAVFRIGYQQLRGLPGDWRASGDGGSRRSGRMRSPGTGVLLLLRPLVPIVSCAALKQVFAPMGYAIAVASWSPVGRRPAPGRPTAPVHGMIASVAPPGCDPRDTE
jgi:hypothetical protein